MTTIDADATLEYTAPSLVNSRQYKFSISAVNAIAEGSLSTRTGILAATIPAAPA